MSLRDSRDNAIIALRFWDDAVDRADDEADAYAAALDRSSRAHARAEPKAVLIDPHKMPLRGG